ncbi:glycoside hydrolase domain-containing protein [Streptomyces sp. URMC 123]|uniref:glycoside hydrolase domain-containing protein n=1 Tax=Streptomyces sp. URMC 123 TaxID=3423403 RepID=UPI003F19A738
MDERVLQAQKWVNSTYKDVSGFVAAPENGKTGWPTMYAFTRALQHELGITSLSNSFGPTTMAKLESYGDIGPDEPKRNIVKIIQAAFWCKGYNPGGISGEFTMYTQGAVEAMMKDLGIGGQFNYKMKPKVFKALLTMDAYVLTPGGRESIRSVQQWLNSRYYDRSTFFLIPTDGHFSRDVQRSLYLAIQYEMGMNDSQANGIFGPGTQAGLKSRTLQVGSSGVFVRLFRAAMIFNNREVAFNDTFDGALSGDVSSFQAFSMLARTGAADFQTWCQLLVSTGDPSRPGNAADCIQTVTDARAKALKAAGYDIVGRYLDERASNNPLNKKLQPGELETIFRNKLRVFPISQYYGGEAKYFNYPQGFQDALGAHAAAVKHGFNRGTVIYFAVDYDATDEEIAQYVIPYFNGISAGLNSKGKRYLHGVYGSRNVCAKVSKETTARWSFVSGMSTGFSGNMGFPLPENWSFNQIATVSVGSGDGRIEIDKDIARANADPGVGSVNSGSYSTVDEFVAGVERLYELSVKYNRSGYGHSRHVLEYLRHPRYTDTKWMMLVGEPDGDWIDYVNGTGFEMLKEFKDPNSGYMLSIDHLAAAANGIDLHGQASGRDVNPGDFAGWGGDLITFYVDWRRNVERWSSGYQYCMDNLAKPDVETSFGFNDMIEDIDGYNLGMAVRKGANIVEEIKNLYQKNGHLSRYRRFYDGRFGGSAAKAADFADCMLTDGGALIGTARTTLIELESGGKVLLPELIPGDKLAGFCKGFGDTLQTRVGQENARTFALRSQGKL